MADQGVFEKGETVRLKSGSPVMVVLNPKDGDGLVFCTRWNKALGKVVYDSFQPFVLMKTNAVDKFSADTE
jgi:uncharacterized protein YodC (DUF2158 family)